MARLGTTLGTRRRFLITAKTYPTPSRQSVESTCVAAVADTGELIRVFPVPFRSLPIEQRFKKWQWVEADLRSAAPSDRRPESHKIDASSIVIGESIPTRRGDWSERLRWIQPHFLPSYAALDARRLATGESFGFLRPSRLIDLIITDLPPGEQDWSAEEKAKLTRDAAQAELFGDDAAPAADSAPLAPRVMLEKLPFKVHYEYEIDTPSGPERSKHKITDWEVGELYRNCLARHGSDWRVPFRAKLFDEFSKKDLVFMMGNMHQRPHIWLIISLIYPPRTSTTITATTPTTVSSTVTTAAKQSPPIGASQTLSLDL